MLQFIVAIRQNNPFGYVFSAYFADISNISFLQVIEPVTKSVITSRAKEFTEEQKKIVNLIENYSISSIIKLFSNKKYTPKEYLQKITEPEVQDNIRPYIEKSLYKIIEILKQSEIPVFFKSDNYNTLYAEDRLVIHTKPSEAVFNIIKETDHTKYFLSVSQGEANIILYKSSGIVLVQDPCRMLLKGGLHSFENINAKKLQPFFNKENILVPSGSETKWYASFAKNAILNSTVKAEGFEINRIKPEPKAFLTLEKDWQDHFVFSLSFEYDKISFNFYENIRSFVEFDEKTFKFIKIERNSVSEANIIAKITDFGLKISAENTFILSDKFSSNIEQQNRTISKLSELSTYLSAFDITLNQSLYKKKYFTEKISLNIKIDKEKDWFDIHATVRFGSFEIPFANLRHYILSGEKEYILPDGSTVLIPDEWFAKYYDFFLFGKIKNEEIRFENYHSELIKTAGIKEHAANYFDDFKDISQFDDAEFRVPSEIKAELRPYQTEGFRWMRFMQKNRYGACLADDMGLGKTLQIITLLTKTINDVKIEIKKQFRESANLQQNVFEDIRIQRRPSLIVVPVSLIHNWENEIMKFSPFLKILKYRGNKRERKIKSFDKYDVIITGYGIVRNDIDLLCEYQFLYVILDESQFIKNPTSQAFKAVKQLKSDYKLVLTGTPVENSLSDLWSQMDFLNEGILGNFNFFKDNFINIIEKNNDDQRADRLKKMIQPFILRRTKDEVAKDLPALNEQTVYCEMSEEHTKFYESEKSKIRNKLLEQIETGAFDTAIPVLQALTQLRQAANHPKLIEQDYEGDSGKFGEVILDIENLIAENHKILIFSSFVKHLKLFVEYFEQKSYKYSLLTGKTTDREKVIDEFQSDPENRIFLISIKAGGTGLNLTQADYVMILDPWWNIAVELQAVNRAHRIGQDKKVMVYRYISKKTVEEKIQKLQEKKLILAESFITTENPLKNLSKENLISLFE